MKNKAEKKETSTAVIAIWYVISNVLVKGLALITTPIFTRLMTKSEYGQFSNFTSWESIITIIVTLDFSASIMRAKYDFKDEMKKYMSSIVLFGNMVTLAIYVIIELNSSFFVKLFAMDMRYIRMLFVYLLFMPAFSYLQVEHRIFGKYKFFVLYSVGAAILRTAISVLLVCFCEDKLFGRISGYLVPMILLNVCLWIFIVGRGKGISWKCVKYACMISIPLIPHALAGTALSSSDKIMITQYCGEETTALYSIAYMVAATASLLWVSMNQAWSPWTFDQLNLGRLEDVKKASKLYLAVFAALIVGVLLIAPEVVLILGGQQYYEARYVMPPVILGGAFQFIYGLYVIIEIYMKKTFTISVGTVGAAILNIVLNMIFIPRYGYMAAAYTTLLGYIALLVFHYFTVKRIAGEYLHTYDGRFIMEIIVLLCCVSAISLWLYDHLIVRYSLIIAYVVVLMFILYKYRTKILHIFKR